MIVPSVKSITDLCKMGTMQEEGGRGRRRRRWRRRRRRRRRE
jgi:hypothetical protein